MMKKPDEFKQNRYLVTKIRIILIAFFALITMTALTGNHPVNAADSNASNVVKRSETFNIPKRPDLQFTYVHRPFNELSGAKLWKGSEYAASIPANKTGQIDYWMPDYGLQLFIYYGNFAKKYKDISEFREKLTKDDMKSIKVIKNTNDLQISQGVPTLYYKAMMSLHTLEGLQYATNLETIVINPDSKLTGMAYGENLKDLHGNLWDISALENLDKLQIVRMPMLSINDVSALANKPKLKELSLIFNQIADLSPLETNRGNPGLNLQHGFSYQHILLTPVTLNPDIQQYTTPSFIIKDLAADNLPVKPFDPVTDKNAYPSLYPSTADSMNIDTTTLTWKQFLPDQKDYYGSLSSHWKDPNSDFEGWIMVPYQLKKDVGNVAVDYKLLQADGKLVTIAPTTVLSGTIGAPYNINTDANTKHAFDLANNRGYEESVILGGTGDYSDYLAGNGKATVVNPDGKYTAAGEKRTIIFRPKAIKISVSYVDAGGKLIADVAGNEISGRPAGKLTAADLDHLKKTIEGYTFTSFQDAAGHNIDDPTKLTYGDLKTGLKLVYTKIKSSAPTGSVTSGTDAKPNDSSATTNTGSMSQKGEVVYALKKVFLYKNATFKKTERIVSYTNKPRINRPMFVVTGNTRSANGTNRYKVRDVNHHSKTAGMTGYITANWQYVRPVYYRSLHKTVTVINPNGVNEYQRKNLTGKVKNVKQGTQLKVKKFVTHNLTTRYQLTNGNFITANRKLIVAGKSPQPKQIKTKKTIYRYNNANFSKRLSNVKKGTVLKVKKWEYSNQYSRTNSGAKRYQVVGGYVTGNRSFVAIIK